MERAEKAKVSSVVYMVQCELGIFTKRENIRKTSLQAGLEMRCTKIKFSRRLLIMSCKIVTSFLLNITCTEIFVKLYVLVVYLEGI